MKIDKVRTKLNSKGFFTHFQKGGLIAGFHKGEDEDLGIQLLENVFSLHEFDENIVIKFAEGQLIHEKLFKEESELLDFIDSNFKKT